MPGSALHLVVALAAEARPLIDRYGLRRDAASRAFPLYLGESVALVVCGPGKVRAAAATGFLGGRSAAPGSWLNVGIAGHPARRRGEVLVAHKVRDRATGESWYPPLLFDPGCPTEEVVTADRPDFAYAESALVEMEASGFYPTACRFATGEVVHCVKVVADGPQAPAVELDAERVVELVGGALPTVERIAAACGALAETLRRSAEEPPELAWLRPRLRLTVTEERRLERLLRRWHAVAPERPLPLDELAVLGRGGSVNRRLEGWLDALPLHLAPVGAGER